MQWRVEVLAVSSAVLLSLSCLLRGAVDDVTIAVLLLAYLPLVLLASTEMPHTHPLLRRYGLIGLGAMTLILLLQQLISGSESLALWRAVQETTDVATRPTLALDKAAWTRAVARFLFLVGVGATSLVIGTRESCSRLFFHTLLVSSAVCIALTFFSATSEGIPNSAYAPYAHGLVNANNAAAYLGAVLLLTLAEAARFFRLPPRISYRRHVIELTDKITMTGLLKGSYLAFAMLLAFSGLLMTGSRAGILLAVFCSALFLIILLRKLHLGSALRRQVVAICALGLAIIGVWCFVNFGKVITSKLALNGVNTNTRLELYHAVFPMLREHLFFGSGLGSFAGAFQRYRPDTISPDGILDKAHNSYLEFGAEMGLPALALMLVILIRIGLMLVHGVYTRHERYITPTLGFTVWLLAALFSLIDFPLQIPGIAGFFLAIILIGASQTERRFSDPSTHHHAHTRRVRIRKRSFKARQEI